MKPGVTFETKCYENDYEFILTGRRLPMMIANCGHAFVRKHLIINNVIDRSKVETLARACVERGLIDEYFFAEDHATAALDFYGLDRESFKSGYYYSISELVGLFLCGTDYLLHFASDSHIETRVPYDWISEAQDLMEKDSRIACATPTWNRKYHEAKAESNSELDNWYVGQGFSDQCYLVRTALFRGRIYNETHPYSERYPVYGGELFEKRVDSYMRNHGLLRLMNKRFCYRHRNFPKAGLMRAIALLQNRDNPSKKIIQFA